MKKDFKPAGYNSVSPYFIVDGARFFIEMLSKVFNVKELRRYGLPDGTIMHMELQLEDTVIMLGDSSAQYPAIKQLVHVYVEDVDAVFKKALEAGCVAIIRPKKMENDPDKRGTFQDFAGNLWSVGTQLH